MERKKILLLLSIFLIGIALIHNLDINLKYKIGFTEYYKYKVPFTKEENEFLKKKPLIVNIYNYPPLSFTNEFNNYNSGIMVDYISQLAIELGNSLLIRVGSKDSQYKSLSSGEADIIIVSKEEATKKSMETTQPLCVINSRVLVRSQENIENIKQLKDKTLIILKKDLSDPSLQLFFQNRNIRLVEVDNMYQAFALLGKESIDGLVGDDMQITHFLKVTNRTSQFKLLKGDIQKKEICLAVKQGNSLLLGILNKGILEIKKKNLIIQTQKKWLGEYDSDNIDIKFLQVIYKIIFAILLIVGGLTTWNYVITRQVSNKTKELSESKEELRLIIDSMKSGLMVMDKDSLIIECNDAIEKYTGLSKETLLGRPRQEFNILNSFLQEEHLNDTFKFKNNYYYITSQKFATNKTMILLEDYTEKYLTEKKVRQEEKMIAVGQLSAGLAHEIRNPLGLIKSYMYVLEKNALNPISTHAVSVIYDSIHRINNLIENLLKFSRLSNDEKRLTKLGAFIDKIIQSEYEPLKENKIRIEKKIVPPSLQDYEIIVNQDVLQMLLINLIHNSAESLKNIDREEKTIHIGVEVSAEVLKIRVADNGRGIEPDKLEHIFDPFYSTKDNGTGLGLYIINTEVYNNDGKISVESRLGEGTIFDIELPIQKQQ